MADLVVWRWVTIAKAKVQRTKSLPRRGCRMGGTRPGTSATVPLW